MKDSLDRELGKLVRQQQSDGIPELVRNRIDLTLSSLPPVGATLSTQTGKRRSSWRWALGAASLLLLICTAVLFTVPTVAERIRSLFARDHVDLGLLRAQEFGLVQHPGIKVRDKGYTIKIDEVVADPTRVVMALQLFGPDGKHDKDRLVLSPENRITIKNDRGELVGKMYDMGMTSDFYYLVAFFPEPIQSDTLTLEGQFTRLGNEIQKIPFTDGRWNFRFSIDMREANKKTKTTSLEGGYTSPDGMTVRLNRLTRMVQGVRLELDTELGEEALARSSGELWKKQKLRFHFADSGGNEIHSVNTSKTPHTDSLMTYSSLPGDKPGLMHWSFTFTYLPLDQPYQFVLDGYSVAETDGSSVQFEPAKLKDHPASLRSFGDEITLRDFTVELPPDSNGKEAEGSLHVDGKLKNEVSNNVWVISDSAGNTYSITRRGSSSAGGTGWKDHLITLHGSRTGTFHQFRIPGLVTIPDRLTLTRMVVDRLYMNTDWAVWLKEEAGGDGKQ